MKPKKRLGQNFLNDKVLLNELVKLIKVSPKDKILEIGPGKGDLTEVILKECSFYRGVEFDNDLFLFLIKKFPDHANFFLNEDILKFDISNSLEKHKLRLVGNIPYNISSPLLAWCEINYLFISDMHFMLQKEFALRCAGNETTSSYGKLSVICNYLYDVEILKEVDRNFFEPKPRVDSSFVKFYPKKNRIDYFELEKLKKITNILFNKKRKKISNSLKDIFSKNKLDKVDINLNLRPDEVSLNQYLELASLL
tara:strand:+ start:1051 stop:1809 length:759 start_codon:yes stop_codon:yes gene_type:complete